MRCELELAKEKLREERDNARDDKFFKLMKDEAAKSLAVLEKTHAAMLKIIEKMYDEEDFRQLEAQI
jgi:hypothetical protein